MTHHHLSAAPETYYDDNYHRQYCNCSMVIVYISTRLVLYTLDNSNYISILI